MPFLRIFRQLISRSREPIALTDELWTKYLTAPSARFRIDPSGNEYVVKLDVLAEKLNQQLADMRPELRQLVESWLDVSRFPRGLISDLPSRWRSFNLTALEFVEHGVGHLYCVACKKIYAAADVTVTDLKFGHEYVTHSKQAHCRRLHELLRSEAHYRLRVSPPSSVPPSFQR